MVTAGILVGIDGSIASRAAVGWAIDQARATRCAVELLLIVDDEWGVIGTSAVAELRSEAKALVERELVFARELAGAVPVSAEYAVGSPMLALSTAAAEHGTLAIGTHKVGSFHGLALGTRAIQLAAMSPVPLAVVPVASGGHRSGVVVGVSGTPGESTVIRTAIAEARRRAEPLLLVRGSASPERTGTDALDHAVRLARSLGASAGVTERRSSASAGETLAAVSGRAVLTIAGRPTDRGGRGYQPLGRTVGDLVTNLGGPVLIVPFALERA